MNQWNEIAKNYEVERDEKSLPAILIDELVTMLVQLAPQGLVLDFGAGSGTLTRAIAKQGRNIVAYEPNAPMRELLIRKTPDRLMQRITVLEDPGQVLSGSLYGTIICINVVDHVLDVPEMLRMFRAKIVEGGRLILCIPHPIKNLGRWIKERKDGAWDYLYYQLDDYMKEGPVRRDREDVAGNVVIKGVLSQHRTISTYFNWIVDSGFVVTRMHEPAPHPEDKSRFDAYYKQCARIPYFWILECSPT